MCSLVFRDFRVFRVFGVFLGFRALGFLGFRVCRVLGLSRTSGLGLSIGIPGLGFLGTSETKNLSDDHVRKGLMITLQSILRRRLLLSCRGKRGCTGLRLNSLQYRHNLP